MEIFARGVRNTVGFDWDPDTGDLWFTDNGQDWLGDYLHPDELNRAPVAGMHFGFPYCHGGYIPDPEFGAEKSCNEFTPPEDYRGAIFIAEHGSWNRAEPIGYRVTCVRLENWTAAGYEAFAEGWLQGREAWGRPVDVLEMPDCVLLVSDDRAGAIYRISYEG